MKASQKKVPYLPFGLARNLQNIALLIAFLQPDTRPQTADKPKPIRCSAADSLSTKINELCTKKQTRKGLSLPSVLLLTAKYGGVYGID
jgi:hypothetical protein